MRSTSLQSAIRLVTSVPGPRSIELMTRRQNSLPKGVGCTVPVFVNHAEGALLEDVDGNRFLDFAGGIGCVNAGHRPPRVVAAIRNQAEEFLHTCFMVTPYESFVELAEALNARTPGAFPKKTFFVNSGAEAVENAVKIARNYTGRQAVIAFEEAFHGRTLLGLSLTGKTVPYKAGFGPFVPEVYRMPYAYCYRCAYHLTYPDCQLECAERLTSMFQKHVDANAVAAVIFEPVLGEGGFVAPPSDWFQVVTRICREHGILTIADEVQTGFCRTGSLFASETFGFEPDLIVTAKSLGSGMPIAAVTGRAEVMDAPMLGGIGGTFGGNPVSCAAALATLRTIDELNLPERARRIGQLFERATQNWMERFRLIGDIRGVGAMRAIELVNSRSTKEPASAQTKQVLSGCHRRGLLITSAGTWGNVIRILVPLVATDEQIEEGLAVLAESLAEVDAAANLITREETSIR
jgi:4-aminobutyrate aminotransferase / (S)-3-amino-2-methylpropionate transaminase / 5-aminovalerate transaminase